ncbi:MAG: hypothetical protein IPM55_16060 [Acidobacteria bacterium]|nr:hypothetical protein [Acidobacteriota bacterium]
MARRIDNECAWCAEEIPAGQEFIGADWKVYCSEHCQRAGEQTSRNEWQRIMQQSLPGPDHILSKTVH